MNMQSKRLFVVILIAVLALLSVGIPVSAAGGTTLDMAVEVSSSTAMSDNGLFVVDEGDIVTVSVAINSNPGFAMMNFTLEYTYESLEPIQENGALVVTKPGLFGASAEETAILKNNTIRYSATASDWKDLKATGVFFTCSFRVTKHGTASIVLKMDEADAVNEKNEAAADAVNVLYGKDPSATAAFIQTHTFAQDAVHVFATCTEGAKDRYTCTVCNAEITVNDPREPAKGHSSVPLPSVSPTCREDGLTEGASCSVCGEVLQAQLKIPAGENHHVSVPVPATPATCLTAGKTEGAICSVCGVVLKEQTDVPVGEHTYGEWIEELAPTEDAPGRRARSCTECGEKVTEEIPLIGTEEPDSPVLIIVIIVLSAVLLGAIAAIVVILLVRRKTV